MTKQDNNDDILMLYICVCSQVSCMDKICGTLSICQSLGLSKPYLTHADGLCWCRYVTVSGPGSAGSVLPIMDCHFSARWVRLLRYPFFPFFCLALWPSSKAPYFAFSTAWQPATDHLIRISLFRFIHLCITLVFQYVVMRDAEKLTGFIRMGIIYIMSGVGGNLASAIFTPYVAEVRPARIEWRVL